MRKLSNSSDKSMDFNEALTYISNLKDIIDEDFVFFIEELAWICEFEMTSGSTRDIFRAMSIIDIDFFTKEILELQNNDSINQDNYISMIEYLLNNFSVDCGLYYKILFDTLVFKKAKVEFFFNNITCPEFYNLFFIDLYENKYTDVDIDFLKKFKYGNSLFDLINNSNNILSELSLKYLLEIMESSDIYYIANIIHKNNELLRYLSKDTCNKAINYIIDNLSCEFIYKKDFLKYTKDLSIKCDHDGRFNRFRFWVDDYSVNYINNDSDNLIDIIDYIITQYSTEINRIMSFEYIIDKFPKLSFSDINFDYINKIIFNNEYTMTRLFTLKKELYLKNIEVKEEAKEEVKEEMEML